MSNLKNMSLRTKNDFKEKFNRTKLYYELFQNAQVLISFIYLIIDFFNHNYLIKRI